MLIGQAKLAVLRVEFGEGRQALPQELLALTQCIFPLLDGGSAAHFAF